MPDTDDSSSNQNQQVKSNAGSSHSSDNAEGAVKSLKLNENPCQNDGDVTKPGSYPERPGEPDCMYYLRKGVCGYGINCRYNHPKASQHRVELPERAGQPDCGYYLKTGTCKFGTTCKYHHPKDRNGAGPVSYNRLGLPIRNDEKPCSFYMRTGSCKFGGACKFHHPQPAATQSAATQPAATQPATTQPAATAAPRDAGIPPSGLSTYTSTGSSMVPVPRLPYMSPPRLNSTPVHISLPAQGWNTYVANLNPRSSPPSIFSPNLVFNTGNQGDQGMFMPRYNIPRRVDQPVCRYFMNTGTCRYGSDCKYHHPEERRTSQPLINAAPPGLPSRPGQALCPSYATFGICKFGSSCRFDHPFIGYPYSYNLAVPPCPLPELAASMVTCYRNPFYFPTDQMNNAGIMKKTTTTTSSTTTKSEETVDASDSSFEVLT